MKLNFVNFKDKNINGVANTNNNEESSIIDQLPDDHLIINKKELLNESSFLVEKIIEFTLSSHISR